MGRPLIPTEACSTVGDVGDIIFADLGAYLTITKSGGVRSESSIHLWFDQDLVAFRFTMRIDGRPWLSAPIARANGGNTLSSVVVLETR
jgi:HK97 family phage major capsid protein